MHTAGAAGGDASSTAGARGEQQGTVMSASGTPGCGMLVPQEHLSLWSRAQWCQQLGLGQPVLGAQLQKLKPRSKNLCSGMMLTPLSPTGDVVAVL